MKVERTTIFLACNLCSGLESETYLHGIVFTHPGRMMLVDVKDSLDHICNYCLRGLAKLEIMDDAGENQQGESDRTGSYVTQHERDEEREARRPLGFDPDD